MLVSKKSIEIFVEDVHVRGLPFSLSKRGVGIAVTIQRILRASYSRFCSNCPVILVALRLGSGAPKLLENNAKF